MAVPPNVQSISTEEVAENNEPETKKEINKIEHFKPQTQIIVRFSKTNVLYLSVNVFSTRVFTGTLFLRLLLETGLHFYVVIRATRRSSLLERKGNTFISQLF